MTDQSSKTRVSSVSRCFLTAWWSTKGCHGSHGSGRRTSSRRQNFQHTSSQQLCVCVHAVLSTERDLLLCSKKQNPQGTKIHATNVLFTSQKSCSFLVTAVTKLQIHDGAFHIQVFCGCVKSPQFHSPSSHANASTQIHPIRPSPTAAVTSGLISLTSGFATHTSGFTSITLQASFTYLVPGQSSRSNMASSIRSSTLAPPAKLGEKRGGDGTELTSFWLSLFTSSSLFRTV